MNFSKLPGQGWFSGGESLRDRLASLAAPSPLPLCRGLAPSNPRFSPCPGSSFCSVVLCPARVGSPAENRCAIVSLRSPPHLRSPSAEVSLRQTRGSHPIRTAHFARWFSARPGFEPGQTEPKSVVLPLHYRARNRRKYCFSTSKTSSIASLFARIASGVCEPNQRVLPGTKQRLTRAQLAPKIVPLTSTTTGS